MLVLLVLDGGGDRWELEEAREEEDEECEEQHERDRECVQWLQLHGFFNWLRFSLP